MTPFGTISHASSPAYQRMIAAGKRHERAVSAPAARALAEAAMAVAARTAERTLYGPRRATARLIIAEVCERLGIEAARIRGAGRERQLSAARAEIFWRLHNELNWGWSRIGRFLCKDHTSVMWGCRRYERLMGEAAVNG